MQVYIGREVVSSTSVLHIGERDVCKYQDLHVKDMTSAEVTSTIIGSIHLRSFITSCGCIVNIADRVNRVLVNCAMWNVKELRSLMA